MRPPARQALDALYEQFARVGKAVSAPARLEILELLAQGPRTVEALADQASLSVANTSRHLQVLRTARLVAGEKRGSHVEYRLADERVGQFWLALRGLAEDRLAEVGRVADDFFEPREAMEPVAGAELIRRVREGKVVVIDVRPADEYRAGHLPEARSIPLAELEARLGELPKRRTIVAYCRGPYCVMAVDAVALLRERGFRAERMESGVLEWRAEGLALETGVSAAQRKAAGV